MGQPIHRLQFVAADPTYRGFRLGGHPPNGSRTSEDSARGFLGVFPLLWREDLAVSLFVSRDAATLFDGTYRIHTGGPVDVVVHPADLEPLLGVSGLLEGTYRILIEQESADEEVVEGETFTPSSGHKLLGEPNVFRDPAEWEAERSRLESDGFVHYLQLDTPRHKDPFVHEAWPFPNGMFHCYLHPLVLHETRWFWEF